MFAARRTVHNRLLRIHFAPPTETDSSAVRLGLAIARRAARRAHDRNRIKRLARESFRICRDRLRPGDYVVTAHPAAALATNRELRSAFDQLWRSLELK